MSDGKSDRTSDDGPDRLIAPADRAGLIERTTALATAIEHVSDVLPELAAPPDIDLDHAMLVERDRWLTWRLRLLCWAESIGFGLFALVPVIGRLLGGQPLKAASITRIVYASLTVAVFGLCLRHLRRGVQSRRHLLALGLWTTVLAGLITMIGSRVVAGFTIAGPAGSEWAGTLPFTILIGHLISSAILPWTAKEASKAGAAMLAALVAMLLFDTLRGQPWERWIGVPVISALTLVPGILIGWLRHSRFREEVRLRVQSSAYESLAGELVSARKIHDSCLPPTFVDGAIRFSYSYEPMRQLGGDLVCFNQPQGSSRMNLALLDVTGHGVAAALTVNRLVGEIERLHGENADLPPSAVLTAINRYVNLTLSRHMVFVTGMALNVDTETGDVHWANAGHPPAMLRRSDGSISELESGGMMLGVLGSGDFEVDDGHGRLDPGDVLLIYTDGAIEAANPQGKLLTIAGLTHLLEQVSAAVPDPCQWPGVLQSAITHYRKGPADDDTLLVVLHRKGEPMASQSAAAGSTAS